MATWLIGGMLVEKCLDLDDGNVFAAANDHVLRPAGDPDVAPIIDLGEVAGVEPSLGICVVQMRPAVDNHRKLEQHRTKSLPSVLGGNGLPSASTTRISTPGNGQPEVLKARSSSSSILIKRYRAVLGHSPRRYDFGAQRLTRMLDKRPRNRRSGTQEGA